MPQTLVRTFSSLPEYVLCSEDTEDKYKFNIIPTMDYMRKVSFDIFLE